MVVTITNGDTEIRSPKQSLLKTPSCYSKSFARSSIETANTFVKHNLKFLVGKFLVAKFLVGGNYHPKYI